MKTTKLDLNNCTYNKLLARLTSMQMNFSNNGLNKVLNMSNKQAVNYFADLLDNNFICRTEQKNMFTQNLGAFLLGSDDNCFSHAIQKGMNQIWDR